LSHIGGCQIESDEHGVVLSCAAANAAAADSTSERPSKRSLTVESLRDHACAPIDPLYGMDQESQWALEKAFDEEELGLSRTQAWLLRVGRTVMGPLLEAWNRALRQILDSYSGCPTCTLLARSTETFDSSTDLPSGPESRTASIEHVMLSNLKTTVDLAKSIL
jgi:hypothetical protein